MVLTKLLLKRVLVNGLNSVVMKDVIRRHGYYFPFKSGDKRYEDYRYDKYNTKYTEWDKISGGFRVLISECKLFAQECKDKFAFDVSIEMFEDQEVVKLWDFNQNNNNRISSYLNRSNCMNDMLKWKTACDSDWDEGYSTCKWTVSPSGRALFSGHLDTKLPLDGRIVNSGFVFLGCERARKSFYRQAFFDLEEFTHLIVRVRGDGRNWMIMLNTSDDNCDITWFDRYAYGLYTHAGPYWQWAKIPFSRFMFQHKGYNQDTQFIMRKDRISQIGFLLADQNTGPFSLEIDYVGVMKDKNWLENNAYEQYYHKQNKWAHVGNA